MMKPDVSIIIPVHNAEQHLDRCLESVRGQVGPSLEILCVDDASTDNSAALIDALVEKGYRGIVIAGTGLGHVNRPLYPAIDRALVLPYALLVSAGNDGRGAVRQAQRILSGIPFTAAAEPLILRGEPDPGSLAQATELGLAFATGLEMGIY